MNILFIKKLYSLIGGSEALTYQWARRLAGRGHAVRVLCLRPVRPRYGFPRKDVRVDLQPHVTSFREGGVLVHQLIPRLGRAGQILDLLPFFQLVRQDLALRLAEGCDIVHNVCREYTAAAQAIADANEAPLVLTPLPHPGQPFSGDSARDAAVYRLASGIVAMTEHEKEWYRERRVPAERIAVVGSGAVVGTDGDGAAFRARHGIEGPIILFVGRRERYKGYLATLAAAPAVWANHPEARFVFIGEQGLLSHLYASFAPKDPRIIDLGVASSREKADAYAACDVFCMPSTHETLGLTYLEAWAYGKPVIGCDIPPLREVIADGIDGLLVQQRSAEVAVAICSLLDNRDVANKMGQAGCRKVATTYAWPNVIGKLEDFYATLRSPALCRKRSRQPS